MLHHLRKVKAGGGKINAGETMAICVMHGMIKTRAADQGLAWDTTCMSALTSDLIFLDQCYPRPTPPGIQCCDQSTRAGPDYYDVVLFHCHSLVNS
jgi:hypothetical protein